MTQNLKDLMDRATDRSTLFVPDVDQLLAGGRRRARIHSVVSGVAGVTAVGLAATATAFALQLGEPDAPPSPAPASQATAAATPPATVSRCVTASGQPSPRGAEKWESMVSLEDKYGSSTVRRSRGQLAFCSELLAGTSMATRQVQLPNASDWRASVCSSKTTDPACTQVLTIFMGQLPGKAVRLTVTPPDGQPIAATVRDGYFVFRLVGKPNGARPSIARTYNAAGAELAQYRV